MKLSCLFGVVMCFGVAAMMALPIDDESFETSNTHHHQHKIPIHIHENSLMDDTPNSRKVEKDEIAALHDRYESSKYAHDNKFGYKVPVKQMADTLNATFENISVATTVPDTNLPDADDIPLKNYVEDPDVIVEDTSIVTNVSETNLPYAFNIPLEFYVKDISNDVSENISITVNDSESNIPYAPDIPLEYEVEDILNDFFENIPMMANVPETNYPYAINIPLESHVDAVFENVSTNDSEATPPYHINIPLEYHEHVELAEPLEGGNISSTTEFSKSVNTPSSVVMTPNESMVDQTEITENCTNCTDILENTTEPKLIGCMCALFTTQHPTENDIPLTSRTFHNVSCEQDVHSEDACIEVCIGVATINNELKDRMVCSFVPSYVNNLKAFLQSKLCEEDAQWNFTGISSPAPICCYMGTQISC